MRIWKRIKHELLAPVDPGDRVARFWARTVGAVALFGSVLATALTVWFAYRAFQHGSRYIPPIAILLLVSVALVAVSGLVVATRLLRVRDTNLLSSPTLALLGALFLAICLVPLILPLDLFDQHPLHTAFGLLSGALLSALCFLAAWSRRGV